MAKLIGFNRPLVQAPPQEKRMHIEGALLVLIECQRLLGEFVACANDSDYGNLIDVDPIKTGGAANSTSPRLAMALQCSRTLLSKMK
jgi:hypothetical protein